MKHDPFAFRRRLMDGEKLSGTFIKTPSGHATEIFGDLGYDFVVIDEEHAPFDRLAIDQALVSARAAHIAALVRVASASPSNLVSVLDAGAVGVLVPHVSSAQKAADVAAACRYKGGARGFSNSPRAGRYGGLSLQQHVEHADAITTVVAQIEDPEALDQIDAIAAVDGIDALFIGRGDLAVALGAGSAEAPEIRAAAERLSCAPRRKARDGFRGQQQGCACDERNRRLCIHLFIRSGIDAAGGRPGACRIRSVGLSGYFGPTNYMEDCK